MSPAPTIPAIHGTITVGVPVEQAFRVFTGSLHTWWPPEYHIGQTDMAEAIMEPREGGRWYERGVDGSECDWGRVLTWEPPHRLVVTWQINGEWQYDPDPEHASEVEVRFTADRPGSSWNTATSTGSSAARRCTTRSAAPAAGPASWNSSARR